MVCTRIGKYLSADADFKLTHFSVKTAEEDPIRDKKNLKNLKLNYLHYSTRLLKTKSQLVKIKSLLPGILKNDGKTFSSRKVSLVYRNHL